MKQKRNTRWWVTCQTWEQRFTGAMFIELANARWSQARDHGEEDSERLAAANNMAVSLNDEGKYAEAEEIQRQVLEVSKRVLGPGHPSTVATSNNLAE